MPRLASQLSSQRLSTTLPKALQQRVGIADHFIQVAANDSIELDQVLTISYMDLRFPASARLVRCFAYARLVCHPVHLPGFAAIV
jgi:hypothetical protein